MDHFSDSKCLQSSKERSRSEEPENEEPENEETNVEEINDEETNDEETIDEETDNEETEDEGAIARFFKRNCLYWLEALSLLRGLTEGVTAIQKLMVS